MKLRIKILLLTTFALCGNVFGTPTAVAQPLSEDVRDVFIRLIDDLDADLAKKFQAAIDKDTATVEFSPAEFRQFRDNPINPFEGLDHINAVDGGGNIALKFELPSLRNRAMQRLERQHPNTTEPLKSSVGSAAASTVRVSSQRKQIALGVIVAADGLIVTKASEVENESSIKCELSDGRKLAAKIVRIDKANDVALLSVSANGLTPVKWSDSQPRLGRFVLTPDTNGSVVALGTYSAVPRSTVSGEQAFLGVQPQTTSSGVKVSEIEPGNASHAAGLKNGDVIFRLGDVIVRDVSDLVRVIRSHRPGDRVAIDFYRNGVTRKVHAELSGRNLSGERAARFKMMNRLGALPSRRADGFPSVFQHDSPLFPEQCGGPITDLDGNVLGMNIARNGRAASYAIPATQMLTIIEHLKHDSLAARETGSVPPN
jgi:S1-C subfamily serine protease